MKQWSHLSLICQHSWQQSCLSGYTLYKCLSRWPYSVICKVSNISFLQLKLWESNRRLTLLLALFKWRTLCLLLVYWKYSLDSLYIRLEDLQKKYWQTPCWAGGKKPDSLSGLCRDWTDRDVVCCRGAAAEPAAAAHPGSAWGRAAHRHSPAAAPGVSRALDLQGEPAGPGGGRPSALRSPLRLPGWRREPAQPQERFVALWTSLSLSIHYKYIQIFDCVKLCIKLWYIWWTTNNCLIDKIYILK